MSILLKEIRSIDPRAARIMEQAEFRSDSEIQSLTREDLHELFPGPKDMKLRRKIFETINKHEPIDVLLKNLQGFIPHDNLKDALSNNGVLADYLHILKDTKAQLNSVQKFIDAKINFLEDIRNAPSEQKHDHGSTSNALVNKCQTKEAESPRMTVESNRSIQQSQDSVGIQGSSSTFKRLQKPKVMVKYKMVVSGKTFNAHQQILDQIRGSGEELNLLSVEENQGIGDYQIILVFCPVVSRIGVDVEAAMRTVPDNKPVILVLMHHTYEAKHVTSMRTWTENPNIVFHVNVFYHEKMPGLVSCKENNDAVNAVRNELVKYGTNEEPSECSAASSTSSRSSASDADNSTSWKYNQKGFLGFFSSK